MGEKFNFLIKKVAKKKYNELNKQKFITPGHNGPYFDQETPVRNTSHWAMTFSYLYLTTGEDFYLDGVKKCGEYLTSKEARPHSQTFYCRDSSSKDYCNGLIGQAWAIEALSKIYELTGETSCINTALEVFLLHPISIRSGLWNTVEIDGKIKKIDDTFNHQLWFAMSGVLLYTVTRNSKVKNKVDVFMENLDYNLNITHDGLIKHVVSPVSSLEVGAKYLYRTLKYLPRKFIHNKSMLYKETGYHAFNMYALAVIFSKNIFDIDFWNSNKLQKMLKYSFSKKFLSNLKTGNHANDITNLKVRNSTSDLNRYGFPYNAPGFELPFVYKVFQNKLDQIVSENMVDYKKFIEEQLDLTFNMNKYSFSKNTEDENTLNARIYEMTRYLYIVNIDDFGYKENKI